MSSMIRATSPRGVFRAAGSFAATTTGGSTGRTNEMAASCLAGRRSAQRTSVLSSPGVLFLSRTRTPSALRAFSTAGPTDS